MHFEVKAVRAGKDVIAMSFDAVDVNDAAIQAQAQGYDVLSVKASKNLLRWVQMGGARFSLMLFSQEVRALLDAGLTQVEALETMVAKERNPQNRNILRRIIDDLYEGQALSHALQQFPRIFPPLYIATIHASEKTGDLDESLARYIDYQSRMEVVRKKVVSASIYPVLLQIQPHLPRPRYGFAVLLSRADAVGTITGNEPFNGNGCDFWRGGRHSIFRDATWVSAMGDADAVANTGGR